MRELDLQHPDARSLTTVSAVAIIGRGRVGRAMSAGLRRAGIMVHGPFGHSPAIGDVDAVLLCVPDAQIAVAAAALPGGSVVGHCSGASGLEVLAAHEAFSLHPLMTITSEDDDPPFPGAGAAVAGATAHALAVAIALAEALELTPIEVAPEDRGAYHAAASIASNFLITLEAAAERLAADAGVQRRQLVPLVRATVENWARLGERALTGPVARGDEQTVDRQRRAIAERAPDLLTLFDALVDATRALARSDHLPAASGGRPVSAPLPRSAAAPA
jgi:predicted short-subunit dehydrogenase-like oxidoreductase (DUF2520 family)